MNLLEKLDQLRTDFLSTSECEIHDEVSYSDAIDDAINRIIEDVEAIQEKLNSSENKYLVAALEEARNMMEPKQGRAIMSGMFESVTVPVGTYTLANGKEALVQIVITTEDEELESVEDIELPELIRT